VVWSTWLSPSKEKSAFLNDFAFIGDTLMQNGYVPIQKILADVDQVCDFK